MRVACAGLLLLTLSLCSGELLTFSRQSFDYPGTQPETLAVEDETSGDVRFVGLVQQYDLSGADDSTRQSLTVWPTSSAFFDGGWQSWVEQQLSAFESLIPRCPHASAMATPPQSDYPSLLSYMATSRFGPSVLTAYARQVDQDLQPGAFSVSVFSENAGEDEDELVALDSARMGADIVTQSYLEGAWEPDLTAAGGLRDLDQAWFASEDAVVAASAQQDSEGGLSEPMFHSTPFGHQLPEPVWDLASFQDSPPEPEEELEWGETCNFVLFIILCIGCVAVWVGLMRAWVSCCHLEQQTKAAKRTAAQELTPNPLLAPLIPEGATRNPAFSDVEVAAEHSLQGNYFVPQGAEYVSIAYMPLKSEARP